METVKSRFTIHDEEQGKSQIFEVWEPIPGRTIDASVEALIDDWEGFRVLLRDHETNRVIRIAFGSHVAYQSRDEGDFVGEASRSIGLGRGCFYRVSDSEYLARFNADSVRQLQRLMHFAIITDMDCIDVLALDEPDVKQL
jgi:hypothetical protein